MQRQLWHGHGGNSFFIANGQNFVFGLLNDAFWFLIQTKSNGEVSQGRHFVVRKYLRVGMAASGVDQVHGEPVALPVQDNVHQMRAVYLNHRIG